MNSISLETQLFKKTVKLIDRNLEKLRKLQHIAVLGSKILDFVSALEEIEETIGDIFIFDSSPSYAAYHDTLNDQFRSLEEIKAETNEYIETSISDCQLLSGEKSLGHILKLFVM